MRAWRRTAGDLEVDRAFAAREIVLADQAVVDVDDLLGRQARIDADAAKPVLQAAHVPVGLEEAAVHDAGDLVDAVAEDEAAVVDGERRAFPGQEFAVQIDHARHGKTRIQWGDRNHSLARDCQRESGIGNRESGIGSRESGLGTGDWGLGDW